MDGKSVSGLSLQTDVAESQNENFNTWHSFSGVRNYLCGARWTRRYITAQRLTNRTMNRLAFFLQAIRDYLSMFAPSVLFLSKWMTSSNDCLYHDVTIFVEGIASNESGSLFISCRLRVHFRLITWTRKISNRSKAIANSNHLSAHNRKKIFRKTSSYIAHERKFRVKTMPTNTTTNYTVQQTCAITIDKPSSYWPVVLAIPGEAKGTMIFHRQIFELQYSRLRLVVLKL